MSIMSNHVHSSGALTMKNGDKPDDEELAGLLKTIKIEGSELRHLGGNEKAQ